MPKLSIIMPVYNSIRFIDEAILSILNQTESDFEFIIIDDGSTDPIFEKIENYAKKDKRIIAIREKENKGLTHRLNDCLDVAKGSFIVRMDGDDISSSLRIEKQLKILKEKNAGFVGCWGKSIDITGKDVISYVDRHCRIFNKDFKQTYIQKHCMIDPSVIFRKDVFEKIGYYDPLTFNGESYNYYLRAMQFFEGVICEEILYSRRIGSSNTKRKTDIDIFQWCIQRMKEEPIIKMRKELCQ